VFSSSLPTCFTSLLHSSVCCGCNVCLFSRCFICINTGCVVTYWHLSIVESQSFTHTHTQPFNGPMSGTTRVGRYQKKHLPTHTHPVHQTSFINFLHLLRSIASSFFQFTRLTILFRNLCPRPFWSFSWSRDPLLHTPYMSSPNHHLFATHAPTITACFAVIPMLCHLFLISLSSLLGNLSYLHATHPSDLPPDRGDIPALNPAEAGTRLSDPGGMQG